MCKCFLLRCILDGNLDIRYDPAIFTNIGLLDGQHSKLDSATKISFVSAFRVLIFSSLSHL